MKRNVLAALGALLLTAAMFSGPVAAQELDPSLRARLMADQSSVAQAVLQEPVPPAPSGVAGQAPPAAGPSQRLTLEQAHAIALRNHPGIVGADFRALA